MEMRISEGGGGTCLKICVCWVRSKYLYSYNYRYLIFLTISQKRKAMIKNQKTKNFKRQVVSFILFHFQKFKNSRLKIILELSFIKAIK